MDLSWIRCTCAGGKMCTLCSLLTIVVVAGIGIAIIFYGRHKAKSK